MSNLTIRQEAFNSWVANTAHRLRSRGLSLQTIYTDYNIGQCSIKRYLIRDDPPASPQNQQHDVGHHPTAHSVDRYTAGSSEQMATRLPNGMWKITVAENEYITITEATFRKIVLDYFLRTTRTPVKR
ncbi:hypothetical protein HWD35_21420 [Tsukamurella tyrosinosolvens]|uniref:hypothetical protein n=1 Tax=Tsukamurella tyrosinosolvens TaxID=57704 RepID=UPI001CE19CAA|nr:hypothetical protein [Tsukamurella tyrosinosolvens]MCA4997287.1 hypothetical protein [Tsukamurella tyrosinosolvens]